jgi:hypothetical protein
MQTKTNTMKNYTKELKKDNEFHGKFHKSIYYGILVIHPHSGEISRPVIANRLKHYTSEYGKSEKEVANFFKKWNPYEYLVFEDVNYKINMHTEQFPPFEITGSK